MLNKKKDDFEPRRFKLFKLNVWEETKDEDEPEGTEIIVSANDDADGGQVEIDVWEGPVVLRENLHPGFLGNYEVAKNEDEEDSGVTHNKLILSFKNAAFLIEALTSVKHAFANSKYTVERG